MPKSDKYNNLKAAEKNGVLVLPMLYLTNLNGDLVSTLENFTSQNPSDLYIVRSAALGEDGLVTSYAGYFESKGGVSESALEQTIRDIFKENQRRSKKLPTPLSVHLIVSPFIKATLGGVAFYPWLYFYNHALIEYATTPQAVVAGKDTKTTLLSLDLNKTSQNYSDLKEEVAKELAASLVKVRTLFNFPLDVEWAFDGSNIYILQIRPITIAPTSLSLVPVSKYEEKADYELDQYSETFGKLSPLSFSLIETLFTNATHYTNTLYFHGGDPFLKRIKTGNILTDTKLKRQYFTDRHWYSSFLRGLKSQAIKKTLESEAKSFTVETEFSLTLTQYAFDRLLLAEGINQLQRRPRTTFSLPQEYELTKPLDLSLYKSDTTPNLWKRNFLASLVPIRAEVLKYPKRAFLSLTEFLNHTEVDTSSRYTEELAESIYSIQVETTNLGIELLYGSHKKAKLTYIENPDTWHALLPKDAIILTPHIPQTWIAELPHLTGIITLQVSPLSHAAITLREYNITTLRVTKEAFASIKSHPQEMFFDTRHYLFNCT